MLKNIFSWSSKKLQSIDTFSESVNLTHMGKEKYSTFWGGWLTAMIYIFLVLYAFYLAANPLEVSKKVNTQDSTEESVSDEIQGLKVDWKIQNYSSSETMPVFRTTDIPYHIDPFQAGYSIAIKLSTGLDSTVVDIKIYYVKMSSTSNTEVTELETAPWNQTNFPYENWNSASAAFLGDYLWMTDRSLQILSHSSATNSLSTSNYISIDMIKCTGVDCKTNTEIQTALIASSISIATIETYLDPNDEDKPLKQFVNTDHDFSCSPYFYRYVDLGIHSNLVTFENDTTSTFYSTNILKNEGQDGYSNSFGRITIMGDTSYSTHFQGKIYQPKATVTRNLRTEQQTAEDRSFIYQLFFIISQLGGMYTFLTLFFRVLVNYFSKKGLRVKLNIKDLEKYWE